MQQGWLGTRCLVTVFLETLSTQPHVWSPQACVRDTHSHFGSCHNTDHTPTKLRAFCLSVCLSVSLSLCLSHCLSVSAALRIHVSGSTISILQRTDRNFEFEKRGETFLKVSSSCPHPHRHTETCSHAHSDSYSFFSVHVVLDCRVKVKS